MMTACARCRTVLLASLAITVMATAGAVADDAVLHLDFEAGMPEGLVPLAHPTSRPKTLEVVTRDGRGMLHLVGGFHTRVFLSDRVFRDGVVETRMSKGKGSYAGIVVRDKVYVYFQMRGALCVNLEHGRLQFQSAQGFRGFHDLKVVCVGPILRAYVDGELICVEHVGDGEGRVGFYSHGGGDAHYDTFRASAHVEPKDGLFVAPRAPGDSLVVAPHTEATLGLDAFNHAGIDQAMTVTATVKTWDDTAVGTAWRRDIDVAAGATVAVEAGLGTLATGFYKIVLAAHSGGTEVARYDDLPLAVQERPNVAYTPPLLPLAAYSKYFNRRNSLYQNTYSHAIARILREHHFNVIVADPSFTREMVDIFQSHGIATIARSAAFLEHPAVIGTLAGDEPKPDEIEKLKESYDAVVATSGKPITTCMVGEGLGLGGDHDPVNLWRRLDAQVRAFRWYGIKKSHYGTLHDLKYKGVLPLGSVLRLAEATADTPWWFVPPSFGSLAHEGYFQNPTPAQMKGLMHMALAHGADGMMLWCLQGHGGGGTATALIDQRSLQPPDGKLGAAAEVAALVATHAELLCTLRYGHFAVDNDNPLRIEAVPRRGPNGAAYLYVVNRDEYAPATAILGVALGSGTGAGVRNLYTGQDLEVRARPGGGWELTVTLGPGDGALLDLGATATEPPPDAGDGAPGATRLADAITAAARNAVASTGIALLRVAMDGAPCPAGDGIGLLGPDDPRAAWERNPAAPRCLSWSGTLHGRAAQGYLPLAAALRLTEAAATRASSDVPDVETDAKAEKASAKFWVAYPAIGIDHAATAGELRAMLHLALAYGGEALLLPADIDGELAAVADEVAQLAGERGKTIAELTHAGLDIRCKDPRIATVPRQLADGRLCAYAVNLDPLESVTANLLLWDEVWNWTAARDVFADTDLPVNPRDEEGYLSVTITLRPGEGKLIATDAGTKPKK